MYRYDFYEKAWQEIPLSILATPVLFVKQHVILGVTLDRFLKWPLHYKRLKGKLPVFANMRKFVNGTRWDSLVSSFLRLSSALFAGSLQYSIPVLYGMHCSTLNERETIKL